MKKNCDLPFSIKRQIMDACFVSSIAYAGEGWLGGQIKPLETLYIRAIKCLLGTRITTCTDMCLLEMQQPSLGALLLRRRSDYLKRKIPMLQAEDPLKLAIDLAKSANTKCYQTLMSAYNLAHDPLQADLNKQKESIRQKATTSSKRAFYNDINPTGDIHNIYLLKENFVPEHTRVAFTRLRLVSHRLRIETGRWARLPKERRTCICDNASIQDEVHAIFQCTLTRHIREKYNVLEPDFNTLFDLQQPTSLCNFFNESLKYFD